MIVEAKNRARRWSAMVLVLAAGFASPVLAQDGWKPSHPVMFIVPNAVAGAAYFVEVCAGTSANRCHDGLPVSELLKRIVRGRIQRVRLPVNAICES